MLYGSMKLYYALLEAFISIETIKKKSRVISLKNIDHFRSWIWGGLSDSQQCKPAFLGFHPEVFITLGHRDPFPIYVDRFLYKQQPLAEQQRPTVFCFNYLLGNISFTFFSCRV